MANDWTKQMGGMTHYDTIYNDLIVNWTGNYQNTIVIIYYVYCCPAKLLIIQ